MRLVSVFRRQGNKLLLLLAALFMESRTEIQNYQEGKHSTSNSGIAGAYHALLCSLFSAFCRIRGNDGRYSPCLAWAILRWSHTTVTLRHHNWLHEERRLGWIDCNTQGCVYTGFSLWLIDVSDLCLETFTSNKLSSREKKNGHGKGSSEPERHIWFLISQAVIPALWEAGCMLLADVLPAPSRQAAPSRLHRMALPPFMAKEQFSLSFLHLPRYHQVCVYCTGKHMLTISKIDCCGIKINLKNVKTLRQAFWSCRLFLCNAECVIKHHFP